MVKCPLSLQNATRTIATAHGFLILLLTCYTMYTLGKLINAKEVSHVHTAKGLVTTVNEFFEKWDLAKAPPARKEVLTEISLGREVAIGSDKLREKGSKALFYSARWVQDQKVQQEIVILTLALVLELVVLMMDVELFHGANEKVYAKVNIWYRTVVILTIAGITTGLPVVVSAMDYDFTWKFYAAVGVKVVTLGYVMCIVNAFRKQLQGDGGKKRVGMKTD